MTIWLVLRKTPAEVAVEGDPVQKSLQEVVVARHLRSESIGTIVPCGQLIVGSGEPVRLVVDDHEARVLFVADPGRKVDVSREEAAHALAQVWVTQAFRVGAKPIIT